MDKMTETAMELCRDPMLAVENGRAVYMNAAARAAFPCPAEDEAEASPLLKKLLGLGTERFVAAVEIDGRQYAVSSEKLGGTQLYSLVPSDSPGDGGLLSDGMMTELLSLLFNISLASDRIDALLCGTGNDAGKYLFILRHSYYSLRRQLTNLNTARQLQDGAVPFDPRRTDLVTLCSELADCVNSLTYPRRAALSFSSPLTELTAWVDPPMVERILLNLLSNSFAHTPPEGSVRLRLNQSGNSAVISVDDNGEGIPPDILRNIFARYKARMDGAHLDRGATGGLGLGIASGLTKLHGGTLLIESREGQGTSVRAMFPLEKPGSVVLECTDALADAGMDGILTELSGLLGPEFYSAKYLD